MNNLSVCEKVTFLTNLRKFFGPDVKAVSLLYVCCVFYCRILLNCAVELVGVTAIVATAQNLTVDNTANMW